MTPHTRHYTVYHTHEQTVKNTAMLFLIGTLITEQKSKTQLYKAHVALNVKKKK